VLVGVAEDLLPVPPELTDGRVDEIVTCDDEGSGGRPSEPGEHAHERRLPRAARSEHDADLVLVDGQGEALERSDAARRRRVDGEEVASVDERGHASVSR
jgi:hypothetical protein